MASAKFTTQNNFLAQDQFFFGDLLNATFPLVSNDPANIDAAGDFLAMSQHAVARDEEGLFWKVGTSRVHFSTRAEAYAIAQEVVDNSRTYDWFNPATQNFPITTLNAGAISAGFEFRVTAEGTFDGIQLSPGDILVAKSAISGNPVGADFYLNEAEKGANAAEDATEAVAGVAKQLLAISLTGSASHAAAFPTEKAVADAILAVKAQLEAIITAAVAVVDAKTVTNAGNISALTSRVTTAEGSITALQTEQGEQNDRLDAVENRADSLEAEQLTQNAAITALEEWTYEGTDLIVGDGATQVFDVAIPSRRFKNLADVVAVLYVTDGNGGYRKAGDFSYSLVEVNGVQRAQVAFSYAPTANMYKVRLQGLSKAA